MNDVSHPGKKNLDPQQKKTLNQTGSRDCLDDVEALCRPRYVTLPNHPQTLPKQQETINTTNNSAPTPFSTSSESSFSDPENDKEEEERAQPRVGPSFQVDLPAVLSLSETREEEAAKVGKLLWDPSKLSPSQIQSYLDAIQLTIPLTFSLTSPPTPTTPTSSPFTTKVITKEEALHHLHDSNYSIPDAIASLKSSNTAWHEGKPSFTPWSNLEVANFELGMKYYYKAWDKIQRLVKTKTLPDLIDFYWFWKTTARYDDFMLQMAEGRNSAGSAVNSTSTSSPSSLSLPTVPLKEDGELDRSVVHPRLRNKPRVDYSAALSHTSRKRKFGDDSPFPPPDSLAPLALFDVGVFTDVDWERAREVAKEEEDKAKGFTGIPELLDVNVTGSIPPLPGMDVNVGAMDENSHGFPVSEDSLEMVEGDELFNLFGVEPVRKKQKLNE